jgi:hypothetical protein
MQGRRVVRAGVAAVLGGAAACVLSVGGVAVGAPGALAHAVFAGYTTPQHGPFAVGIQASGQAFDLLSAWTGPCQSGDLGQPFFTVDVTNIGIGAGGRIDASGQAQTTDSGTESLSEVHVTASISGTSLKGTYDDHVVLTKGGAQIGVCDSGAVAFTASRSLGYAGVSSQNLPVSAIVTPDKHKVRAFVIYWSSTCIGPAAPQFSMFVPSTDDPVKAKRFSDSGSFTTAVGSAQGTVTLKMSGGFGAKSTLKGTFQASVSVPASGGSTATSCQTGPQTWSISSTH